MSTQGSVFASQDTRTLTLSTGHTVTVRDELMAGEAFEFLRLLREPGSPERSTKIALLFLVGWSLTMPDGTPAPLTASSLDALKLGLRLELDDALDKYSADYLDRALPESLRVPVESGDDPTTADSVTGETSSPASASR